MKQIILVDDADNPIGQTDIVSAHRGHGQLHRAVSLVGFRVARSGVEILVQKRSHKKPLWPLFWSNTVCTHPVPGEDTAQAVLRRLQEEMGITMSGDDLRFAGKLQYQADFGRNQAENELDSIYITRIQDNPIPNPEEISEFVWKDYRELIFEMNNYPAGYTPWFRLIVKRQFFIDVMKVETGI